MLPPLPLPLLPACRRPLHARPPSAGEPHTVLQQQVSSAAPGVFATLVLPAVQQQQQYQQRSPAPAAQPQPQPVPAQQPAAAPHCRAGDQPPAKRARLVSVVASAGRATAVDTPAEEAAKAAGGCCCVAFGTQLCCVPMLPPNMPGSPPRVIACLRFQALFDAILLFHAALPAPICSCLHSIHS